MSESCSIRQQAIDSAYMAYRQGADWSVETGVDAAIAVMADQEDTALSLLREFDAYASAPDDTGYVDSPFQARVRRLIAPTQGAPE